MTEDQTRTLMTAVYGGSAVMQESSGVFALGFVTPFGPLFVGRGASWDAAIADAEKNYPLIWKGFENLYMSKVISANIGTAQVKATDFPGTFGEDHGAGIKPAPQAFVVDLASKDVAGVDFVQISIDGKPLTLVNIKR